MTASAKPLRQDELIEEIIKILKPSINWDEYRSTEVRQRLRTAIAQYTLKIKEQE